MTFFYTQQFRKYCQKALTGKPVTTEFITTIMSVGGDLNITAEMLKQEHPDFEGADLIIVRFDEVSMYIC